jgi:Toastrack DUF4097
MKQAILLLALATVTSLASAEVTETIDQTYALAPDGVIRLSHQNGTVDIKAWDRAEVHVVAEKRAENAEELARINVGIDSQKNRLTIETKIEGRGRHDGSVHYTLQVPARAILDRINAVNADVTIAGVQGRVQARTVNGNLHMTGVTANSSLETENGNVTAELGMVRGDSVKLTTINGTCTLVVPAELDATVLAISGNGHVQSAVPLKVQRSTRNYLKGDFGEGGTLIEVNTVNGNVLIRRHA